MQEYYIAQKQQNAREAVIYQFSHILSWFLHFVADFISKFIKALFDAAKMMIHIG